MQSERPTPKLSPREEQLLEFAASGLTDAGIAHKLGISEATVGTYWGRVRIKLGPYSRTELVALKIRGEKEAALECLKAENEQLVQQLRQEQVGPGPSFKELLENAPDAMIVISGEGTIEYTNTATLELFGYEENELIGQDLLVLVPPRFRNKHSEHRKDYILNPDRRQMGEHIETPALHKSGKEFRIRAALSAITTLTTMSVICAIRPAAD